MIKNMLQAASKMLISNSDEELIAEFKSRVQCAKIIIDEIVNGMGPIFIPGEVVEFDSPPHREGTPIPKKVYKLSEPEVGVKDGKLVEIKNVPLDGLVELDGKKMTHEQAIGKSFNSINILWK